MRAQGFAVAIIVACGVAMMVMALGAHNSLQASQQTYYDQFRFSDVFTQVKRAPESKMRAIRDVPGIAIAESRVAGFASIDMEGFDEPIIGQFLSFPETGQPDLNRVLMHSGRLPAADRATEVIANKAFADAHELRPGDDIIAVMNGKRRTLSIVGIGDSPEFIYALGPNALLPDEARFGIFWMNRKSLEAIYDMKGAFNDLTIQTYSEDQNEAVVTAIDGILDGYGGVGAYDRSDQLSHAFIESEMNQMKSMAIILPPIFLLVSAMLINAILSRITATERQQIGILKAFGYSNREISWHYIKLGLAITFMGIIMGFVIGSALARYLTHLYSISFRFPILIFKLHPFSFFISAITALLAAVVGASRASLRAASLEAAEAMNPEPPQNYGNSIIQNLASKVPLDEPSRMIIRHVTRWPARATTTILGIAAAMGLLVGTLFSFDSIDLLTETFFYQTDPYEVNFNFAETVGDEAILAFAKLPGVVSVEPNRMAAVTLRKGPREERAPVIGLVTPSSHKHVIGQDGQYLVLPDTGLVLSSQLANMLDARVGDMIETDFITTNRNSVDIPVTAIAAEYIGAFAYMNLEALNRQLMSGSHITGGYATLDQSKMSEFQQAILDRPIISGLSLQSAAIASFETTLEETIAIMMTIYSIIGGAIAAGVVYNAARISLTERGRELASMRVLGFRQTEVAYILIGELVLLTILALPVGLLFGHLIAFLISSSMSSELYRVPYVIENATVGYAAVIVLIALFLSSLLIFRRVQNLDLIEVLKTKE